MNAEKCQEFFKNQTRNPLTGRKITLGGPVHRKLMKECKGANQDTIQQSRNKKITKYKIPKKPETPKNV